LELSLEGGLERREAEGKDLTPRKRRREKGVSSRKGFWRGAFQKFPIGEGERLGSTLRGGNTGRNPILREAS